MTTNSALKTTGVALVGGALIFGNIKQASKNRDLAAELDSVRKELRAAGGPFAAARTVGGGIQTEEPENADSATRSHTTAAKLAALSSDLAEERKLRTVAEEKIAALRKQLGEVEGEVVVAFGKVAEIGRDFGNLFGEAHFLSEMEQEGRLEEEEVKRRLAKFYQNAAALGGLSQQIIEMEGDPKEGSEFFSATYSELFGLQDAERAKLRDIFEKHITAAIAEAVRPRGQGKERHEERAQAQ